MARKSRSCHRLWAGRVLARAEARIARIVEGAITGTREPAEKRRLSEWIDEYLDSLEGRQSPNTIRDKRSRLPRVVRELPPDIMVHEVDQSKVYDLRTLLYHAGLSHASVNRTLSYLSAALEAARVRGYTTTNPVRGVPKERETKRELPWLSYDDQLRLIGSMPNQRMMATVAVLLDTGIRVSEFLRLVPGDVREGPHGAELVLGPRKNRKGSTVPLQTLGREAVRWLTRDARAAGRKRLSPWKDHRGVMYRTFRKGVVAAGLGDVLRGFHDCRHVYAASSNRAGIAMADVSRLLGVSMKTALRYADHAPASYRIMARERIEAARREVARDLAERA